MHAAGQSPSYGFSPAPMSESGRVWMWTRLAVAYLLLECALWTSGEPQKVASLIFLTWVIATTIAQRPTLKELGLGVTGLAGASVALVYTAIAFGVMVTLADSFGTLRSLGSAFAFSRASGYVLWSFIQEFILNAYFYLTLEKLLGNGNKAMWGAIWLFVLAHIPNVVILV